MLFSERRRRNYLRRRVVDVVVPILADEQGRGATYLTPDMAEVSEKDLELLSGMLPESWIVVPFVSKERTGGMIVGVTVPATWHCACVFLRELVMTEIMENPDVAISTARVVYRRLLEYQNCQLVMPSSEWFACTGLTSREMQTARDLPPSSTTARLRAAMAAPTIVDPFA